jgi:hypothetical protein
VAGSGGLPNGAPHSSPFSTAALQNGMDEPRMPLDMLPAGSADMFMDGPESGQDSFWQQLLSTNPSDLNPDLWQQPGASVPASTAGGCPPFCAKMWPFRHAPLLLLKAVGSVTSKRVFVRGVNWML